MKWMPIETAPKDRDILVKTSDFGIIQARWDASVENFYKSQKGWASYDPENSQGDWVADFCTPGDTDRRLYCGATPQVWCEIEGVDEFSPAGRGFIEEWVDENRVLDPSERDLVIHSIEDFMLRRRPGRDAD